MTTFRFFLLTLFLVAACSSSSLDSGDGGEKDGAALDGDPGADGDISYPDEDITPVYGIFQLYGDEYTWFRQQMNFTLQDYWAFVDEHAARLDVRFTRTNTLLIWALVEPELGAGYVWNNEQKLTDDVIAATFAPAPGKEMDILLVISPARAGRLEPHYPTGLESEYQDFVRAVVERYDGDGDEAGPNVAVKHWQVMNEPVMQLDQGLMTVQEYAQLARLTAQAVREADPEAKVYLGDVGLNLPQVVGQLSGEGVFDGVDIHYWIFQEERYQAGALANVRQLLDTNGYSDATIWMCEFGTHVNQAAGLPYHSPEYQARWLVKAMVANRAGGVSLILWNNLVAWKDFGGSPDSPFNFTGLISTGTASSDDAADLGKERVAYHAYQKLIEKTDTRIATLEGEVTGVPAEARAFEFKNKESNQPFFITWSDGQSQTVNLSCPASRVRVTNLVPDESGNFTHSTFDCSSGSATVAAGEDPLLVEPE